MKKIVGKKAKDCLKHLNFVENDKASKIIKQVFK